MGSRAEGCKADQSARSNSTLGAQFVKENGEGPSRCVAVTSDVGRHLFRRQTELLSNPLENAVVGLVRDHQVEIVTT